MAMSKEMATPTVQIDNDHLRVTEWRFAPGAATGYHRHEHDYVVVPTRDGELKLIGPKGEVSTAQLRQGKSYFRNAGVEHDVINNGAAEMIFIEIELKDTAIGKTV
jgi:beta-alanine degradation protein BauB